MKGLGFFSYAIAGMEGEKSGASDQPGSEGNSLLWITLPMISKQLPNSVVISHMHITEYNRHFTRCQLQSNGRLFNTKRQFHGNQSFFQKGNVTPRDRIVK